MKKVLLVLSVFALLSLCSTRALAQRFNAGLIVGPTFCQVDGDSYYGFHQLGITAGAYANLPLEENFSVQMELKYSLLGAHSSHYEITERMPPLKPYSLRLHYAEIPLMLQYNLGVFRVSGRSLDFLTLEAGISADVRLRATEDVDADYQVTTSRWSPISATANAGVHVAFNDHLGLGARFMYSVVPCRFSGNPGWFYNQYYNKVVQITLTYNINSPLR